MKVVAWAALGACALCSCSDKNTAGGTLETENSVAVQIRDSLGVPVKGIVAHVRPLWFLADTSSSATSTIFSDSLAHAIGIRDLTTDRNGWLYCDSLPLGMYRLEVGDDSMAISLEFDHSDTTALQTLGNLILQATGTLQGNIALPAGARSAWVQLYGSEHKVHTDSLGEFELAGIPVGAARIVASTPTESSILAEDLVLVRSGRTSRMGNVALPTVENEDPLTWRYNASLKADTLVHDWMLPLSDTTMLTFRLEAPDFDFSQAMADGRDLRITDAMGHPLRYERVRWDSTKGKAIVRVRVSNLDSNTFLQLRWGHPGAIEPDTTGLWKGVPDSVHQYLTQLLLGDFESGTSQTDLPSFLPSSWWYVRASDTSVDMTPVPYTNMVSSFQSTLPGRPGKAAHITYTATPSQWVLLGATLSNGPRSLATLDSLVIYAKGSGILSVAFDKLVGSGSKSWVHVKLDSTWTRHRIRPSDLLAGVPPTEVVDWSEVEDSVTNLTFLAAQGTEFWVDSVMLYGIGVEDLR